MDFSYPRNEKLKGKKLIDALFAEGKSVSRYPIKLFYLRRELPEKTAYQAGVAVPKRNFKLAVARNRVKRLLREAYRLNKHQVFNNSMGSYAFLFLYLGKEMPTYDSVEKAMLEVLKAFSKKIDSSKTSK